MNIRLLVLVFGCLPLLACAGEPLSDAARHQAEMMNPTPALHAQKRADGVKVLFLGNSITLLPPLASVGWTNNWGMAARAPEKDFVHLVAHGIARNGCPVAPDTIFQSEFDIPTRVLHTINHEIACSYRFRWMRVRVG